MSEPGGDAADIIGELFGIDFPAERLAQNLAAFRDILGEIRKLRELDLTDVPPVVSFSADAASEGAEE